MTRADATRRSPDARMPGPTGARVLTLSAALSWGLQFAFLTPVIGLLLARLYDATPTQIGVSLAVYNAGGFVATLLIPAWADRRRDYLRPLLVCALLTLALAAVLASTTSFPVAVVALIVLGGPGSVGMSLLFADMRHSGAPRSAVMNTRAVVSFAWVAGPPLATFVMSGLGDRAILPVLAVVAVMSAATTLVTLRHRRRSPDAAAAGAADHTPVRRSVLVAIVVGFVLLQATNSTSMTVMSLFVTERLGLPLVWSGVALGVAALLEIPALLIAGRLTTKVSTDALVLSGMLVAIAYYVGMSFTQDPVSLVALQVLNAWATAVVAGLGLTLFQDLIPRPGLASGMFTNTRKIGAVVSGGVIAVGAATPFGYQGVFVICAALTVVALLVIEVTRRRAARIRPAAVDAPVS